MPSVELGLARVHNGRRYRLGVMGGTFDPIHHGHLVAASEVAARFDLDEVVFVPTGVPWQKKGRRVSQAEDRYLMTVIATASNPSFSVSRVDIDLSLIHISEPTRLLSISYAVFCLKKKN